MKPSGTFVSSVYRYLDIRVVRLLGQLWLGVFIIYTYDRSTALSMRVVIALTGGKQNLYMQDENKLYIPEPCLRV